MPYVQHVYYLYTAISWLTIPTTHLDGRPFSPAKDFRALPDSSESSISGIKEVVEVSAQTSTVEHYLLPFSYL